jgi:Mor family transcriptional regulator
MNDNNETFEQLADIVGEEAARQVAASFAGTSLYIPKGIAVAECYKLIRKEFEEGATYRDLSSKYGYTETHIRNIIHHKHKK